MAHLRINSKYAEMLNKFRNFLAVCHTNITFRSLIIEARRLRLVHYPKYQGGKNVRAFTDWEFDGNIEIAKKLAADFWPQMKAAGASRFRGTQTVPNLLGSMTPWRTRE